MNLTELSIIKTHAVRNNLIGKGYKPGNDHGHIIYILRERLGKKIKNYLEVGMNNLTNVGISLLSKYKCNHYGITDTGIKSTILDNPYNHNVKLITSYYDDDGVDVNVVIGKKIKYDLIVTDIKNLERVQDKLSKNGIIIVRDAIEQIDNILTNDLKVYHLTEVDYYQLASNLPTYVGPTNESILKAQNNSCVLLQTVEKVKESVKPYSITRDKTNHMDK